MSDDLSMFETALADLGGCGSDDVPLDAVLRRVARLGIEVVESAQHAGITLDLEGAPRTAAYTDPEVPAIDQVQYETGDGPCLDALRTGQMVLVDSTRQCGRWQAFRDSAFMYGVLSTMSLPITTPDGPIGAMNFYAQRERAFGSRHIRLGALLARQAGLLLTASRV